MNRNGFVLYGDFPHHLSMGSRTDADRRAGKTTRLDVRAEPDRAEEVLDRSAGNALRAEHFDRLLDAMDAPYVPNAALRRAASRTTP